MLNNLGPPGDGEGRSSSKTGHRRTVRKQHNRRLGVLAAECASPRDVDRFVLAVLSSFAGFVARKVEDPESYLLQWIALEQELAAAEDEARDDTDDDRDTDVN
jgi:hypothetical protein